MQRTSFTGGRVHNDPEAARRESQTYSKSSRGRQGLGREFRLAWQQKRVTRQLVAATFCLACLALIIWGLVVQFGVYKQSVVASHLKSPQDLAAEYNQQLDALIDRTETERQKALEELQPAFEAWQNLKAEASQAHQRLRESRAVVGNIQELHGQRLNTLDAAQHASDAQVHIGSHSGSVKDLKNVWEEELQTAKETFSQMSAQDKQMLFKETKARHRVETLRQDVQAMGAALSEYVEQKSDHLLSPLRGARQPGNIFDRSLLLEVFSRNLEGLSRKRALRDEQIEEQAAKVLKSLQHPIRAGHTRAQSQAEVNSSLGQRQEGSGTNNFKAELQARLEAAKNGAERANPASPSLEEGLKTLQDEVAASSGFEAHEHTIGGIAGYQQHQEQQQQHQQETDNEGRATQVTTSEEGTMPNESHNTLHEARYEEEEEEKEEEEEEGKQWLSDRWSGKGDGIIGPHDIDISLRCERSQICEGIATCSPGLQENLGCIQNNAKRQEAIRGAAKWAWDAYKKYAFGNDELLPLSQSSSTWFDLGLTLVDSLDTLLLLGLDAEYEEARTWVAQELKVDPDKEVNLFETTIRVLGGLLAAFHLTNGDKVMLYKSASLGLRLLPAFESVSGIPFSDVNLHTHSAAQPQWTSYSSLSEITSLSLEYSYLARASGEKEMAKRALAVTHRVLEMNGRKEGLAPIFVNIATATLHGQVITLGARGDSYYEYLLKQWLLSGKKEEKLLRGYEEAMRGVRNHMLMRTDNDGLLFVGELTGNGRVGKMDHLVCFLPGLLALGHHHGINTAHEGEPNDLQVAEDLMRTCYEMYRRTPTGLAPEIAFFKSSAAQGVLPTVANEAGGGDFVVKQHDSHNLLRPETTESLFVLWRVTRKKHFQEWAWTIFRAFQMHTRVESGGYANLETCLEVPALMRDKMESFWLAETLKYLYLTLDESEPQLISLDEYVLNTEAHPFPTKGSLADISAGHSYESAPYKGVANLTLDARIQYWEDLAKEEARKVQKFTRRRVKFSA